MMVKKYSAAAIWMLLVASLLIQASLQAAILVEKVLVSPASGQANVGELVNFQITIRNTSRSQNIISLTMEDTYTAPMLKFLSAEPVPDTVQLEQGYIEWQDLTNTFGDLGPGKTFTISTTFRAIAPTIVAGATNTVTVHGIDDQKVTVSHDPVSAGLEIGQSCGPDPYEPNDLLNQGKSIGVDEAITAYICPEDDKDYFTLSVSDPGTYYIRLFNLPADYNLYLLDSRGGVIEQSENKGTEPEAIKFEVTSSGRWSILVIGNQSFSNNHPYRLIVTKPSFGGVGDFGGEVEASGLFVLKGLGLPAGDPTSPNIAKFYFDKVDRTNLMKTITILPDGRLGAGLKIPSDAVEGPHVVITQVLDHGGNVLDVHEANIHVMVSPGTMELWVDDAWDRDPALNMPVVNKLVPESSTSIGQTKVDVNCRFIPSESYTGTSVKFLIQVENNKFAAPDAVYVRSGFGGSMTSIPFVNEGGGAYSAVITGANLENKQCVFRFLIPTGLASPDMVDFTGLARNPEGDVLLRSITEPRQIRLNRGFVATIFLNRSALFRDMVDADVAELLAQLHIHSQNNALFGPHDKRAAIYYIDNYIASSDVTNWNNMTVDYSSEFNANKVPRSIWFLMQEVLLQYSYPTPFYLMIIGNDEQFPFYRMKDPSSEESSWVAAGGNPAMQATANNFYFTDNFYGFYLEGSAPGLWQDGNMDLVVGRIIGDGAQDMKEFYLNGIAHSGDRGRIVMASVDGWELGYEPDDNRAGEIKDHLNVPGRLAARGFSVLNDGEIPRTIDKMSPYPSNWSTGFKNSANAGMDLFFIGGHNGYEGASLPGDGFDPSDTPSKYTRFDDDNPIVMIVGCHGGLPVPNLGGWPGGANKSMVYDVIRSGARAYYGASGFSYGSPGNLHGCLLGELLVQYNFDVLTQFQTSSSTLGYAIRQGKINYPFGIGNNNAYDKKTVTEFNLFGVPWQRLSYPGSPGSSVVGAPGDTALTKPDTTPGLTRELALLSAPRQINQLTATKYQQTFTIVTNLATPAKLDGFDIIDIPGGEQQYVMDAPVLPGLTQHSIALPPDGQILSLSVDLLSTTTLGKFNIPTATIGPWTVSGIHLSEDTNMNYIFPDPGAETREGRQSQYLLTVFPVRHNPTTNETVLNDLIRVTVTYDAPVPYGILDFESGEDIYGPGILPSFSANVFNMGPVSLTMNADLAIWDKDSDEGLTTETLTIGLAAGGVYHLTTSGSIPLEPGRYGARLRVWDAAGSLDTAASSVTEFEVKEIMLSDLAAVYDVLTGKVSLSVQAMNLGDSAGTLALAFAISENGNIPLDVVTAPPVILSGSDQSVISGQWQVDGVTSTTCMVEAVASFEGTPTNSAQTTFTAFTKKNLVDAIINHLLGKIQLNQSDLNTADRNGDNVIDVGDAVQAVNELE